MPEENAADPSFAALLRRYRRAAGLTQEQLAERAGLSARAVSDLERDEGRAPRRDSVDLLLAALDLTVDERAALERAVAQARGTAHAAQDTSAAGSAAERKTRDTLPAQPTPFIGREREIAAVRERLLDPETRLLTLTGPGGMGKTRLALQVAAAVRDQFPDGVIFVALAVITDPDLVLPTVAQVLNVKETPGQTLGETLATSLHGKRLLLVLDNFEQILPAAPAVMDLLAVASEVKALITSRAALHLRGERLHQVSPLTVPMPPLPSLEALSQYEAVRLFIARARDARPDFAVTNETAPAVAEICARLDGLPLAIELVAARTRVLSPEALLARLGERLRMATGGARDLPDRQRTLRAAIDWSYSLLDPAEQRLFARLAVFAGGRTLEAVEAVCDVDGDLGIEVVDGVESLLDKSLLRQEDGPGDEARLVMLETIHEYARERLVASGEQERLKEEHARYFLALAERAWEARLGSERQPWLVRLEVEHDNLRAALQVWLQEDRDGAEAVRMAGALRWFWQHNGHSPEGRTWLERALAQGPAAPPASRARALNGAGTLSLQQGEFGQAQVLHDEALTVYRAIDDRAGVAESLNNLSWVAHRRGDHGQEQILVEQALALWRELADKGRVADALGRLGNIARSIGDYGQARTFLEQSLILCRKQGEFDAIAVSLGNLALVETAIGDYARACALHEEALALFRQAGNTLSIPIALDNLGEVAFATGDYIRAQVLHEEALVLDRDSEDEWGIAFSLHGLGNVALELGEYARARTLHGEALTMRRTMGDKPGIIDSLEGIAILASREGQATHAAYFLAAAADLRTALNISPYVHEQTRAQQALNTVRAALGDDAFAAAWAAGQALSLEEAIRLALDEAPT